MTAPAIRYHRFSTKSQDKGSSIERQDERTMEMVRANGWTLAGPPLEDRGRSAWKGDHLSVGHLGQFKKQVATGEIARGSVLVIENLDRLSRENVRKARRWIEEVTEAGIKVAVWSLNKVFDEASLSGENIVDLIQYLLEAQRAHAESARKSEMRGKVIERQAAKAKRGEIFTPRAPAWLTEVDGRWAPCPVRAPVVIQIYEWAKEVGLGEICKRLNRNPDLYPAWTTGWKSGKSEWKVGYIKDILMSPAVEGEYHRKRGYPRETVEVIEGYFPRIVDAELVAEARRGLIGRRGKGGAKSPEAKNLFSGKVKCGTCGNTMTRYPCRNKQGRVYQYFICRGVRPGTCDHGTQFRYDLFETAALQEMLHLALDNNHFVKAEETGPLIARVADLRKTIELRKRKLTNIELALEDAETAEEVRDWREKAKPHREALTALTGDLEKAEAELSRAQGSVSPDEHFRRVLEVRHAIHSDDPETREQARRKVRNAIQNVVRSIDFDSHGPSRNKKVRRITMILEGGHKGFIFDGDGNVVERIDYTDLIASDEPREREMSGMIRANAVHTPASERAFADILRRDKATA